LPQHRKTTTKVSAPGLISVIVPAYDEAHIIQQTLAELTAVLESSVPHYEIVVVDDGSSDATAGLVAEVAERDPRVRIASYQPNHGKGYALRHGYGVTTGDTVVFFDSDLDIRPAGIPVLMELLQEGNYDVVVGSKRHKDSDIHYPLGRRIFSRLVHALVWMLFRVPVRDTQVGLKVFRRQVLDAVMHLPRVNGFAFDVELLVLAQRAGFRIGEGPVTINYQPSASHVGVGSTLRALTETLGAFYRMRVKEGHSGK
jgi:glycosyltransferase involved in cell wall biosynthesis